MLLFHTQTNGKNFEYSINEETKEIEEKTFVFVGFHSFKNFQDALKEVVDLKFDDNFDEKEYDIIHCIIPKEQDITKACLTVKNAIVVNKLN